ncbi:hypothetical protein [Neisseria sp. Ec49-e6-T10]|uniref:hypothetical protein n=1 Tax=Neisseria sp. Ec49-e6-T10 TaxID=3140744 RepID=UPI003EBB233A
MKTKCPACGAVSSLDVLIACNDAREVVRLILNINNKLCEQLIQYLGLFRPSKTDLSWSRTAKLLNELVPDIQAQKISRNGHVYSAPLEAWSWAIDQAMAARTTLKLPLKTHGYLYEILSSYQGQNAAAQVVNDLPTAQPKKASSGLKGLAILERMKNG